MATKSREGKKEKPMLKQMVVRIAPELIKRVKVAAIESDISLQEFVTRALNNELRKGGKR